MSRDHKRWKMFIAGDTDTGGKLRAAFDEVESGKCLCSKCDRAIKKTNKYWIIGQPLEYDGIEAFDLILRPFCLGCGEDIYRATLPKPKGETA